MGIGTLIIPTLTDNFCPNNRLLSGVVSGLENLVGEEVTVFTDMKPSGKVKASDGRIYEAALKFGGFASKGERLKVTAAEQGRLYCEK